MSLVEHDQPIQTLATDRADQSLAKRVRLRDAHRRPENRQTQRRHRGIDALGIDAVTVVNDPSVRLFAGCHHPELLRRPIACRMFGHIPVQDAASPTSNTTTTYSTRNVAVTVTKKSHANTALA